MAKEKKEKQKKEKKEFNTYKKFTLAGVLLILVGIAGLFISLGVSTLAGESSGGFILGVIILAVCVFLSIIVFNKRKYYCPICGIKYNKTGNYIDNDDYEISSGEYRTTVSKWLHVEYECPICGKTKIIVEKHKIGSYS